eukprot:scaffold71592_cov59-Attheya_sp.AAC.1
MSDVECSVGGVAEVSHGDMETHDEATAWFWFTSWPVIWEMMDWFVCVFCGVADCCEEDVVVVDCCEGGGLYHYKGIMFIHLAVKGFQVHDVWSFQRVEGGTKKAANPEDSPT